MADQELLMATLRRSLGALAAILLAGCNPIVWHGPFEGRVLDATSGEPIAGAAIAVLYYRHRASPRAFFLHDAVEGYAAADAIKDQEGRFFLPGLRRVNLLPLSLVKEPVFNVFAKGYEGCDLMAQHAIGACGQPDIRLDRFDPSDPTSEEGGLGGISRFEHMIPRYVQVIRRSQIKSGAKSDSHGGSPPWKRNTSPSSSSP